MMNITIFNDFIVVDGKRYTRDEEIPVLAVKHPKSNKIYYFEQGLIPVQKGEYYIFDTMKGEQVGFVDSIIQMQRHELQSRGAYLPLKKVLRRATGQEIQAAYDDELPF